MLIGSILALVAAYFVFDLGQYFSLEHLKASRGRLLESYAQHRFAFIAGYFLLYVAMTALALPVAGILTLAGGALFGFWTGAIVVSFASSMGAAIAFVVARFLLRDWVQNRFGDRLRKVNQGIERDGAFYLFTIRLIPVFPFFVVNAVMALTPLRLGTYYWVSQVGMLPATLVFVNAGRELGRLESLSGILSPGFLFSFALLGLFPLTMRKGLEWFRKKRGTHGEV